MRKAKETWKITYLCYYQ